LLEHPRSIFDRSVNNSQEKAMNTNSNLSISATPLAGKVALVTGGTSGIGRVTAELFRGAGARVILTGQDADRLETTRRELPEDVVVLRADARSIQDAERVAEEVRSRFGRLDVVFLNAGVAQLRPFDAVDEAHYEEHVDVNVKGVVFTLLKVLPLLGPGASVMVNTSLAAHKGTANMSMYSLSKGAVSSLVRALAVEFAGRGIRVNAISPATIKTPIQVKFGLPSAVLTQLAADLSARIPLGRFGEASEVAQVALFLASDASSYITGAELPVDGGFAAA
jgi:NAD(P)-dependent dehydrogenase (short-subunit alcohol dehydrogenase family)